MKQNINNLTVLKNAFESRNQLLLDEIEQNKKAIDAIEQEINELVESESDLDLIGEEIQLKMVI